MDRDENILFKRVLERLECLNVAPCSRRETLHFLVVDGRPRILAVILSLEIEIKFGVGHLGWRANQRLL